MTERQNSIDAITGLQDTATPIGEQLRGIYKRSGAYSTFKDRLPVILTRIIDSLSREKENIINKYGKSSAEDLKLLIGGISKLKNEMVTNKPLVPLVTSPKQNDTNSDISIWNKHLEERTELEGRVITWYGTVALYAECYMYRRITEAFRLTETLVTYDPFSMLKNESFWVSVSSILAVSKYILGQVNKAQHISPAQRKQELSKFLRLGLWGNRCDLSLSSGVQNDQTGDPLQLLDDLEKYILVDDTNVVWDRLTKAQTADNPVTVDIVLDNAGYELFTDLCIGAFLIANNLAHKVRFYVKSSPWFISDVTMVDFNWTIETMSEHTSPELSQFGKLLKSYLKSGAWSVEDEPFWTYSFIYSEMAKRDSALYAKLSKASFIIFKGDLNYRKLVGDVNWKYSTSFLHSVQGFLPQNFVALRSIKADTIAGLKPKQGQDLDETDPTWMLSGKYGLIQAAVKA